MKYELVWYLLKCILPDSHVMSTDISNLSMLTLPFLMLQKPQQEMGVIEDLRRAAAVLKFSDASGQKRDRIFFAQIYSRQEECHGIQQRQLSCSFLPCLLVLYFMVPRRCRAI